ncbi:succinate dehydrogenase, cytochrome b556 subunit [Salinarimonas ramus]|uniref:Succinate dehydrogenase cytochrome b556 subunit n=1 Tax=Salinarimonas ramus TaxID=690164 RepID=A0A917QI24_9HYPH|nr:succinate dehydrogenase, cytochrome b556 subunit [Salinarimonas ramus]GGK51560.1 succinate dehydrogenase cytochrome b556 subunit [Salinarimonas ramus]
MSNPRPQSPNMQNYRPQLTSVMSFGHRLSGSALVFFAFGLSAWLVAGAAGPLVFDDAQAVVHSIAGRVMLILASLAVFYHLCNGIRHLIWDSVHGFELRAIYAGGWAVVGASLFLTSALWIWVLA